MRRSILLAAFVAFLGAAHAEEWRYFGGDAGGSRYSAADQINRTNVRRLREVWRFSTGEFDPNNEDRQGGAYEATPILVDGRLIFTTPYARAFAMDPETGRQLWRYDGRLDLSHDYSEVANRGAAFWIDARAGADAPCRVRIFYGTLDGRLMALDSATGRPCTDFGRDGAVDLTRDVRATELGEYTITSPPVIAGDLVITGSAVGDNRGVELELGVVRAFDARTGAQVWRFDPIPRSPDNPAAAHWRRDQAGKVGAANAWAPLSVDQTRELVFVPTGSASPDFFGGERLGDNLYANSLVALRASTGEVAWSRQLVHHDLWDYDLPAQPVLVDLERNGRTIPAVIQPTKMGLLFTFHRETGEPIFAIEERRVPQSDVPGEASWPTQAFPVAPPSLVRNGPVTPDDAWGLTPWDRGRCRELIARFRSEGIYTPPSFRGSIFYPSFYGGSQWGGIGFDPGRQVAIANVMQVPAVVTLAPREKLREQRRTGDYPDSEFAPQEGTPYGMRREILASPLGIPCTPPPWGALVAVDMKRGRILWKKPLGTTEGRTPYAFNFGMPNAGGPLLTRSGLIFIAATEDARFRAFDVDTGALLWQTRLPAGGIAGPMTYSINGRQYVVVVAGGHERTDAPMGDYVVAFALHGTGALAPPPNQGFWLAVAAIGGGIVALTVLLAVRGKRRKTST